MTDLLIPGQTAYKDFGPLHVRIDRHDEGVTITVARHDILNRQFTNLAEGRQYLALLRDLATAGKPMWLIESAAGAWTSAAAVVDDADQELIDSINTTMDNGQPQPVDVSDIVDDMPVGGSWAALRQQNRRDFTRTRVHTQPPTPAQLDRIRQHVDGVVTRAPGQPWVLLRGIVDRRLGVAHEQTGQRITSVRLNHRGLALAQTREEIAA